jgi:hypothetical protein
LNASNTPDFSGTGLGPWLTQVDGDFLLDGPTESLDKTYFVPVPIMYTTTTDEAAVFKFVDSVKTDADFQAFIAAGGPESATIAEIEKFYPNDWAYQRAGHQQKKKPQPTACIGNGLPPFTLMSSRRAHAAEQSTPGKQPERRHTRQESISLLLIRLRD